MFVALVQVAILALLLRAPFAPAPHADVTTYRGTFTDGATYLIEVPSSWNGTLVLFSHGYIVPGSPNPATDVGDGVTGSYLLANGYALAGSSYAGTGWVVGAALTDQIAVLDTFAATVGSPVRTIAWGQSMGGLITAALLQQYPQRIDAALPMCGAVAGAVGIWNTFLDSAFAFNTLLAGGKLQVVDISNPTANYQSAQAILDSAQNSADGQARIALIAALGDIPGWFQIGSSQPAPTDYASQEANQFRWLGQDDLYFGLDLRAELETRAAGNPSWNTGIDYRTMLAKSVDAAEVTALYARAGLSLAADLGALKAAAKISADSAARTYLSDNIILDGQTHIPILTMQTEGDGLVVNESESAYAAVVTKAGDASLLRRTFVDRAGHCAFTSGETIAAFGALVGRLNSGKWTGLTPALLNGAAQALGSTYNPFPPAFAPFTPGPYLRTYDGVPPVRARRAMRSDLRRVAAPKAIP